LGVSFIPEDRLRMGVALDFTVAENLIMNSYSKSPFAFNWFMPFRKKWFLHQKEIMNYADRLISEYDIKTPSKETLVKNLSGGNIQRVILARELSKNPRFLIAAQPTRGLDVGATEFIRNKIMEQKSKGPAILLISEDLDEIMTMSDRIAVMYKGKIAGIIKATEAEIGEIGLMMAGAKQMPIQEM
jgi:simple sugar transport system ATP-binding protein